MTSDLVINFLQGIAAKRQPAIDRFYDDMDDEFQEGEEVGRRFQRVFDEIDDRIGNDLRPTVFSSEGLFFSLALAIYDALFGLGSTATSTRRPGHLPNTLRDDVIDASVSIRNEEVSADLLDAIRRAPVDAGRRQVRHEFLLHALDLTSRS